MILYKAVGYESKEFVQGDSAPHQVGLRTSVILLFTVLVVCPSRALQILSLVTQGFAHFCKQCHVLGL